MELLNWVVVGLAALARIKTLILSRYSAQLLLIQTLRSQSCFHCLLCCSWHYPAVHNSSMMTYILALCVANNVPRLLRIAKGRIPWCFYGAYLCFLGVGESDLAIVRR